MTSHLRCSLSNIAVYPQASRFALVPGLFMTSRILRSDVSDATLDGALLPLASRFALVPGLFMTSRILRSDVSDALCGG
jgi:hypothetical protein